MTDDADTPMARLESYRGIKGPLTIQQYSKVRITISEPVFDVHGHKFIAVPVELYERIGKLLGATPHEDDGFWSAEDKADMADFRALHPQEKAL